MRLHLNKTLRAAVIAAITTVGFTLTSAQAADVTLANVMNQKADTPIIWGENGLDLTSVTASCTTAGVRGNNAYENSFRAVDINVGNDNTWTYTLQFTTGAGTTATLSSVTADLLTFNGSNNPHNTTNYVNVDWTLSGGGQNLNGSSNNAELTFRGTANANTAAYASDGQGGYVTSDQSHYCGGTVKFDFDDFSLASETTYTLTVAVSRVTTTGFFVGIGNVAFVNTPDALVWQGTAAQHAWSQESSWGSPFTAGADVVFDGTAESKTATVDTAVTAGRVTVSGAAHTFELNSNLTAGTLAIAEDGGLTLTGTNTMAVTGGITIAEGGSLTVGEGSALKLGFGNAGALLQTITGAGDIHIAADTLFAGSSAQTSPTTTHATGALIVDEGKTLQIGTTNTGAYAHTYVNMTSFNKVLLDGSSLWIHNDEFDLKNVTVTEKGGTVTIHDTTGQNNNTLNLKGTTQLDGTLTFNGTWKQKFTIDELAGTGTLKLAGTGNDRQIVNIGGGSAGELQIGKSNVEANITDNLTLGGLTGTEGTVNAAKDLTFNGSGTYSYTGTLSIGGQITKTGAGSQTISGTALHHTILAQAGTLVLKGDYAIDAIAESTVTNTTVDYQGNESANGFHKSSGEITVYSGAGALDLTNGHFMYANADVTEAVQTGNGKYTLESVTDKSTVYVTEGSLDIAHYVTPALTGVVLSNNTTVNMDAATTVGLTLADGATSTVNADEATTISSISGAAAKLVVTGDSVVTLASANAALTAAVEIGGTATVKLGNVNALGNTSGVTVLTGATLDVNGTKDQNTCIAVTLAGGTLTNTGNEASFGSKQLIKDLVVTQDSTVNTAAHDFGIVNGSFAATKLALNATLEKVGSHDFHLANTTVTGAGAIKVTEGAVWFGRATNAGIGSYASNFIMNGGKVKGRLSLDSNITVTTAAEGSTFEATVANGGHTITYAGDYDLTVSGAISGVGGIVKDGTGTLTLSGNNTYTGTTEVKDGKLVVNGTVGTGEIILAENASIENNGTGAITLSDVNVQLTQVENYGEGVLKLQNASGTLSVVELNIAPGSTISFYDKGETPAEGTITVTEYMMAGGGTLLANLTMANGSTLDVNGGDAMALTLGSRFTIAEGALVTLDDATLAAIADLANINDKVILINQLDGSTLTTNLEDGDWARTHFDLSSITGADFTMYVQEGQIGIMKSSNVPEPTTGTLSLLALAALAARRRRK